MSYVDVGKVKLFYQVLNPVGSPTVIMVHGLYTHHAIFFWCGAKDLAEQGYRVVVYDLRGHGFSKGRRDGLTLTDMASDLLGLMDALSIGQAFLVGYSFGGTVVVKTATVAPERVTGLALLEAAGMDASQIKQTEDVDQAITDTLAGYSESIGLRIPTRSANQFRDQVHRLLDAGLTQDMMADVDYFQRLDWDLIPQPALLVYGRQSPYIEDGRLAASRLPSSRLILLDGDHNMVVRQGAVVARRLVDFFRAVSAGAPLPDFTDPAPEAEPPGPAEEVTR